MIDAKEAHMRWIYLAVIILFAAATIIFALQNFEIVTISFLGSNARAPFAVLVAIVYLLDAATGGSLFALLRRCSSPSPARPRNHLAWPLLRSRTTLRRLGYGPR
jgi:uncharacterized integral membrane protein